MKKYPYTESTDLIIYDQKPKKREKTKSMANSCLFQLLQQIIDVEASPCIRGGILFLPVAQYISFPVGQAL